MLNSCVENPKVGPLSSHSCNCSDALWAPRHQASKVRTHRDLVRSVLPLHGQTDDASRFCPLAANFASGLEPFKHLLCVTVHPHILALELRVPMGLAALAPRKIASHPLHLMLALQLPLQMSNEESE